MRSLDEVSVEELSQIAAPLSESDRSRLTEFWSLVIETSYLSAGEPLPAPQFHALARTDRRELRRRTGGLVRALPSAQRRSAADLADGVAA